MPCLLEIGPVVLEKKMKMGRTTGDQNSSLELSDQGRGDKNILEEAYGT